MIVAAVTIILIIIIGITAGGRSKVTFVENIVGKLITPIQGFIYDIGESVSGTFNSITNLSDIKRQNAKLEEEITKLKKENRTYEDIIMRKEYLRKEAILKDTIEYNYVESEIIGKDPGNWFDKFIIDKGAKAGIKKGDAVVQAVEVEDEIIEEGLVGKVIEVGDDWAKVISIIDEGNKVSYKVLRTQDGGIIAGSINGEITGYLFDNKAEVVKGYKVVTSGLGGVYIKDLYIGEIVDVTKNDDDLMKTIKLKSAIDFKRLNKVFVITDKKE